MKAFNIFFPSRSIENKIPYSFTSSLVNYHISILLWGFLQCTLEMSSPKDSLRLAPDFFFICDPLLDYRSVPDKCIKIYGGRFLPFKFYFMGIESSFSFDRNALVYLTSSYFISVFKHKLSIKKNFIVCCSHCVLKLLTLRYII